MRNQYGIWNTQRWLRSSRVTALRDKGTPAPFNKQNYYEAVMKLTESAQSWYGGHPPADMKRKPNQIPASSKKGAMDKTLVIRNVEPPASLYDQHSSSEWKAILTDTKATFDVIPRDDPFWLERRLGVYASGDLRYFIINSDKPLSADGNKTAMTLMAADIGVRLRPFSTHKFSGVMEARFFNGPDDQKPEEGFDAAQVKSAYLIFDDLAYNSFAMGGLFRPQFGNYDPDHNSLSNDMTGLDQYAYFRGVSVGTAPNVPFLIVNYLAPYKDTGAEYQTTRGYVVTGGARFVSYGLSLSGSLWKTNYQETSQPRESTRDMYAFTAGGMLGRFIANFEFVRISVDSPANGSNAGNVMTLQNKLRVWRENYLVANYASANTYRDLTKGSGTEMAVGFKSFPFSNFELEGLYVTRDDKTVATTTSNKLIQVQLHAYF